MTEVTNTYSVTHKEIKQKGNSLPSFVVFLNPNEEEKFPFPRQCSLETDAQGAFRQQPGLNASPGQNSRACTEWSPGAGQPNMMYVQGHLADWALASMRRDTDKAMGKEPLIFFRSLL